MTKDRDEIAELTLKHLQFQREVGERIMNDISDIKFRVNKIEETLVHHTQRFDRVDERLARIEKRLELVEA